MAKRVCYNCKTDLPPETAHYEINNEVYCTDCVTAHPYTSYSYYINDEYVGDSEDDHTRYVESLDDEYEGEEVGEEQQ
ncbi:hypothetical protein P4H71_06900 [Paenibacillus kribbensis]|uniref:hypothetical protein n=1 Tax=Paenibacillus kribbensis TaxID=172713 RepID=UPI002DB94637|nr:hypothetical protein [Paenibacillus kribbensis]MEC0234058.1 hypothetical protein [Paenibacillus kribbensis]